MAEDEKLIFGGWPEMPWKRKQVQCADCGGDGGFEHEWVEQGHLRRAIEQCETCEGKGWVYEDEQD